MPEPYATYTWQDHDGEKTTTRVYFDTLNAANFDAKSAAALAVRDALETMVLGNLLSVDVTFPLYHDASPELPSDPLARREVKFRVKGTDNTNGLPLSFEVGTADQSLTATNEDYVLHVAPSFTMLQAALAGLGWCNIHGNTAALRDIVLVHRNI